MNLKQLISDLQGAEHFLQKHQDRHAAVCSDRSVSVCPICVDVADYIAGLRRKVITSNWRLSPTEAESLALIGITH